MLPEWKVSTELDRMGLQQTFILPLKDARRVNTEIDKRAAKSQAGKRATHSILPVGVRFVSVRNASAGSSGNSCFQDRAEGKRDSVQRQGIGACRRYFRQVGCHADIHVR